MTETSQVLESKKAQLSLLLDQHKAIKAQISVFNKEIEELENPKHVSWEPKGGRYYITSDLSVNTGSTTSSHRLSGMERTTKEQAKSAANELRRFARMLAYRDEFAPGYVFDSSDDDNAFVSLCGIDVYMPLDASKELDKKLKSGEVAL